MGRVSVIIPGRNEHYFQQTIDSCLKNATGDIEIVPVFDGYKPEIKITDERVKPLFLEVSIGQRAAYNLGVKYSSGEYVMKLDAHALPSKGYDEILQSYCPDNAIVLPEMRRLDVHEWKPKPTGKTHFMFFGLDLYCHFWSEYAKRKAAKTDYPEVMTGQGSCWFTTRKWNYHIGLLDEGVGSWGNVGIEVSLRTWLCGGTQILNKKAWQAHWFRKDEGGFTYPMDGRKVAKAHRYTWENYYFKDDAFKNQTRPFRWIIEKFAPVPGWEAYLVDNFKSPRVIVYYTDNQVRQDLANCVRSRIKKIAGVIPIYSVSQEPINFGKNICIGKQPRKYKSIHEAILKGVESVPDGSIVYLCEHDVFYHPSHFAKLPDDKDTIYFNTERFYHSLGMPSYIKARGKRALSQAVGYKEAFIQHLNERLKDCGEEITERWPELERRSQIKYANFASERPNIDILHENNFTPRGDYKRKYLRGEEKGIYNLPGWGSPKHFGSITGYKIHDEKIKDTEQYVMKKFGRWLPQHCPVRIPKLKRKELPSLFKNLDFKVGAEVGVREGRFSERICLTIPKVKLYCVDLWGEYEKCDAEKADKFFQQAQNRLSRFNVEFVRKPSMKAIYDIEDGSLDFVYIDADHTFDFVMQDVIEWSKKVRRGGIISGHDYYRTRGMGVCPAIDAYTAAHRIDPWFITDEKEASFFWVKS